jgi:hypothetical protein
MSQSEGILEPLNRNYIDTVRYVRNTYDIAVTVT